MSGQSAKVIDLEHYRRQRRAEQETVPAVQGVPAPVLGWMPMVYMPVFFVPMVFPAQ